MDDITFMVGELTSKVDNAVSLLQEMKTYNEQVNERVTKLEHWKVYVSAFGAGVSLVLVALYKLLTGQHG